MLSLASVMGPGVNNRAPMTANGIYQMVARRGASAGSASIRTGSVTISVTPGWTGAAPKGI
jgi:hypothetical protein